MAASGGDFSGALLAWFDRHGRKNLPWQVQDPYRVWVAEIMLQQTQVTTVIPYFERFIARFPDIATLAEAPIDEVLHLWSGLGYYARARNLHQAARLLRDHFGGRFPREFDRVQALPGVGRSTAGAILALAFGQRQTILDGNVKRVLGRYLAIPGWPGRARMAREYWAAADRLTPHVRVRDYTQAIMDLGATLCTRGNPACAECPLQHGCEAHRRGATANFPERRSRPDKPNRHTTLLLLRNTGGEILLERRPPSGIWGGLWSLPEFAVDGQDPAAISAWCQSRHGLILEEVEQLPVLRHTFTHFELRILPLLCRVHAAGVMESPGALWYNSAAPSEVGLATPIRRLLAAAASRSL